MSDDCLFCKIIAEEIPAEIVYSDERVIAIQDINPQAPTHLLVIPREHIPTVNDAGSDHESTLGYMSLVGQKLASERGIAESGYRMVMNCNREGGQTVFHIHLHLLGGRQLTRLG